MDAEIGTFSNDSSTSSISFDDINKIYNKLLENDPYYNLIKEKFPNENPKNYIVLINMINPDKTLTDKIRTSPFVKIIENNFIPNCAVYIMRKNYIGM